MKNKEFEIFLNLDNENIFVGSLFISYVREKEVYSFEYSDSYLANKQDYLLDPELPLSKGRIFKSNSDTLFGSISDLTPDRWGRTLIKHNNKNQSLFESDYLVNVSDYLRLGALRIKDKESGLFLSDTKKSVPTLVYINKLFNTISSFEDNVDTDIKELLYPGSSLGGARPKANIIDNEGNLYIAKFPSKNDTYDVELWEKVCSELAKLCGINVPKSKLTKVKDGRHVFLVERFDRKKEKRIPYSSFMNALNGKDGNNEEFCYLDLLSFIKSHSVCPKSDSEELFRRSLFFLLIHNSDNHLRNHGLLYEEGWKLSPAFDINPSIDSSRMTLSVDGSDYSYNIDSIINNSIYFGISKQDAKELYKKFTEIISTNWKKIALINEADEKEIKLMSLIFDRIV